MWTAEDADGDTDTFTLYLTVQNPVVDTPIGLSDTVLDRTSASLN